MKKTISASANVIDRAKVLGRYELALIRRKLILRAGIDRLTKLEKRVSLRLNPAIDAELQAQKALGQPGAPAGSGKATVAVGQTVVEVQQFDRLTPKYKDLLGEFADETMVDELLKTVDADGDLVFLSLSKTWKAKLLGRNAKFDNILKP